MPLSDSQAHRGSCDFSYAGLKTSTRMAISRLLGESPPPLAAASAEDRQTRAHIAAAFQARPPRPLRDRPSLLFAASTGRTPPPPARAWLLAPPAPAPCPQFREGEPSRGSGAGRARTIATRSGVARSGDGVCLPGPSQEAAVSHLVERTARALAWAAEARSNSPLLRMALSVLFFDDRTHDLFRCLPGALAHGRLNAGSHSREVHGRAESCAMKCWHGPGFSHRGCAVALAGI